MTEQEYYYQPLYWELEVMQRERMCPQCFQLRGVSQFEESNIQAQPVCASCRDGS